MPPRRQSDPVMPRSEASVNAPPPASTRMPPPSTRMAASTVGIEEVEALRRALSETVASAARARVDALEAAERDLVGLAIAIAERVLDREIAMSPSVVTGWARAGIEALADKDDITIAIGPDLARLVPVEEWEAILPRPPIVDPTMGPAECEVRGKYSRIDEGLKARLAAVVDALEAPGS